MFLKIALETTTIKMTLIIQRIAAPTQVKHPSPSLLCRPESFRIKFRRVSRQENLITRVFRVR